MGSQNSPPRMLLWDRGSVWDPIVRILTENRICEVTLRFAFEQQGTHHPHPFYSGDFLNSRYRGGGQHIYDKIYETLARFIDMNCRNSGYDTTVYYNEKTFHDHLHIFNQLFDYFYDLLTSNRIDLVLFSRVPHLGADFLLYVIAQSLGIRSVFLWQSLFPEKFFFVYRWDDFGDFSDITPLTDPPLCRIDKKHEKDWFYIAKGRTSALTEQVTRTTKRSLDPFTRRETIRHLSNPRHYVQFLARTMDRSPGPRFIKDLFTKEMRGQALFRYHNERRYRRNLERVAIRNFRYDVDYVYFPLHLQPEATTSALGGIYFDQALAIERLSKLIPSNWFIYIKDNPLQNSTMRGRWFFERINAIENAVFVPTETNTFELTKHCRFVSTITGTAGWEAISGGKNVLVFGQAWYKTLPGVFTYDTKLTLQRILEYQIDHGELEKRLSLLQSKMGDGVVDSGFIEIVENFDFERNARKVAESVRKIFKLAPA
jgi:hypothetical protein